MFPKVGESGGGESSLWKTGNFSCMTKLRRPWKLQEGKEETLWLKIITAHPEVFLT
jgi:hypothetical protein